MNPKLVLFGAGAGLVLVVAAAWAARNIGGAVVEGINPLNPENVFSEGADSVATVLTGRDETLGGWLAELFDPATRELARVLAAPPLVVLTNPVDLAAP